MPREVVVQLWCEQCFADGGRKTPAVASWTVGAVQAEIPPTLHTVDLCEPHNKTLEDLAELLAVSAPFSKSRPPPAKAKPTTAGRYVCPVCDSAADTAGHLVQHVWQSHRPGEQRSASTAGRCRACGEVIPTAQGMAVHRRRKHGWDALGEALSGVHGYHGSS